MPNAGRKLAQAAKDSQRDTMHKPIDASINIKQKHLTNNLSARIIEIYSIAIVASFAKFKCTSQCKILLCEMHQTL